jgi:hypothetical protein
MSCPSRAVPTFIIISPRSDTPVKKERERETERERERERKRA